MQSAHDDENLLEYFLNMHHLERDIDDEEFYWMAGKFLMLER